MCKYNHLLFLALLSSSIDFISLPNPFRFTLGEIIFIFLLLPYLKTHFSLNRRLFLFGFGPFLLIFLHSLVSFFITGIYPSLTSFIRPFVYLLLSVLFCSSLLSSRYSSFFFDTKVIISSIRNIFIFYTVTISLQAFKLFPPTHL